MKKPCSEMFCLRNQDITDAKAFFYLFFMSNSGYHKLFQLLVLTHALPRYSLATIFGTNEPVLRSLKSFLI